MSLLLVFLAGDAASLGAMIEQIDPADEAFERPPFLVGHASCGIGGIGEADLVRLAEVALTLSGMPPSSSLREDDFRQQVGDANRVPRRWIEILAAVPVQRTGELARQWLIALDAVEGVRFGDGPDARLWIAAAEKFLSELLPLCRLTLERGCEMVYGI